jgi:hypothetical protein
MAFRRLAKNYARFASPIADASVGWHQPDYPTRSVLCQYLACGTRGQPLAGAAPSDERPDFTVNRSDLRIGSYRQLDGAAPSSKMVAESI